MPLVLVFTSQQKARSALLSVLFHSDLEAEVLLYSLDFFFCYLSDLPMPPAPCEKNIPLLTFSQSDHFRCKYIWLTIALKTYSFKQPYFQRRYFSPFFNFFFFLWSPEAQQTNQLASWLKSETRAVLFYPLGVLDRKSQNVESLSLMVIVRDTTEYSPVFSLSLLR